MIIMHKSWCGACKQLRPKFAASNQITELSKTFIMVNSLDEETPHAEGAYMIDGSYVPRIYFLSPEGTVVNVINERGLPQYRYYYSDENMIIESMKKVISLGLSTTANNLHEL